MVKSFMSNRSTTHGQIEMAFRTHGGRRKGAGRPPKGKGASERHQTRPPHDGRNPVHVTIRVVGAVTPLRRTDIYQALRDATITTGRRESFRIVHMSIQGNHVHLIVEAEDRESLSKGVWGFSVSAAKCINTAISKRTGTKRRGQVIADRYHARPLKTPREVRHAIRYVLNNWRHHRYDRAPFARTWKVDPFSSGVVFPDWKELEGSPWLYKIPPTYDPLFVRRPRTWLLAKGWQQYHPLISVYEVPGD